MVGMLGVQQPPGLTCGSLISESPFIPLWERTRSVAGLQPVGFPYRFTESGEGQHFFLWKSWNDIPNMHTDATEETKALLQARGALFLAV